MAYKRYYIIGGTLLTIFLALQFYGLKIVDVSGDVYCKDTCVSYFNVVNPTANTIYIYNKNNIKLEFVPEIKDYQLYVFYYNKWKLIDFTNKTKLVPSAAYVFSFPRYSTRKFKLVGNKESWKNVKWSFSSGNKTLDPVWISGEKIGGKLVKEICNPVYSEEKGYHYKITKTFLNGTQIKEIDYIETKQGEQIGCEKTGKVNISGEVYSYKNFNCRIEGSELICISDKEGGKWASCKPDGSVTCFKKDLVSDKETFYNSLKTGLVRE